VPGIYLRNGDTYVAMTEQRYDAENVLQRLIASHPEMLASDHDGGHGRLLFIRREAGVSDVEDRGARWSLDHLYLDAQGVPTLVEVKRSSDTRGRREVVAQMLDYAANARTSFSAEQLEAWLADDVRRRDLGVDEALRETLGIEDPELFWEAVRNNLAAERLRLIFVSDSIGRELRRIIEFLNGQMERTEVLAIEVKQYVAEGGQQTIVPRVIGDTEKARQAKIGGLGRRRIDRGVLVGELRGVDARAAAAAERLLDWAARHPQLELSWSRAADIRLPDKPLLLRIRSDGTLEVTLRTLRTLDPSWDAARIEGLVQRLGAIGVRFASAQRSWPKTPLAPLADAATREQFVAIIDGVIADLVQATE
jgi:hypothetical protein